MIIIYSNSAFRTKPIKPPERMGYLVGKCSQVRQCSCSGRIQAQSVETSSPSPALRGSTGCAHLTLVPTPARLSLYVSCEDGSSVRSFLTWCRDGGCSKRGIHRCYVNFGIPDRNARCNCMFSLSPTFRRCRRAR